MKVTSMTDNEIATAALKKADSGYSLALTGAIFGILAFILIVGFFIMGPIGGLKADNQQLQDRVAALEARLDINNKASLAAQVVSTTNTANTANETANKAKTAADAANTAAANAQSGVDSINNLGLVQRAGAAETRLKAIEDQLKNAPTSATITDLKNQIASLQTDLNNAKTQFNASDEKSLAYRVNTLDIAIESVDAKLSALNDKVANLGTATGQKPDDSIAKLFDSNAITLSLTISNPVLSTWSSTTLTGTVTQAVPAVTSGQIISPTGKLVRLDLPESSNNTWSFVLPDNVKSVKALTFGGPMTISIVKDTQGKNSLVATFPVDLSTVASNNPSIEKVKELGKSVYLFVEVDVGASTN